MQKSSALLFSLAAVLSGCGASLDVTLVQATHAHPSNVAMFFTVDDADGNPVGGLTAESFRIYEDEGLVSVTESQQTILNPEVAAEHYTLLLVDMSGSVTESDAVQLIAEAAGQFTSAVGARQQVGVYAFDGSAEIHEIQPFRRSSGGSTGVGALAGFRTQDPSTNLNGAIVQAIAALDEAMASSEAPLTFGTLVVFSDGSDRAARVSHRDMNRALNDAAFDVFAVGVGTEIDEETLKDIGLTGYVMIEDAEAVSTAFAEIGERILAETRRFYLLSYCSPARAGHHEVTIEAVVGEATGSTTYEFDADGFEPDCDPNRPPEFESTDDAQREWRVRRGGRGTVRIDVQ